MPETGAISVDKNKIIDFFERQYRLCAIIILCIAIFNIFFNLGNNPVLDWDEARHGISAYEMIKNNNWIVTTYHNNTDYWNLKPPVGVWLIALSYKIFGYNSLAMRFPSALSAFFCILLIMYFARKTFNKTTALLSGLILSSSFVFIEVHSGRNGDFDAQMALITLLTVIFLSKTKKSIFYFYLSAFLTSLAFLVKSFSFIQPAGIILLYWIINKEYKRFKWGNYLIIIGVFFLPIISWAVCRYFQDGTSFFIRMFSYDLIQRSTSALEGHSSSNLFYLEPLILKFLPWSLFFFILPFYKNRLNFKITKYSPHFKIKLNFFYKNTLLLIWILVPLFAAFFVKTKNEWYINSIYPALSIFIAWHISDLLYDNSFKKGLFYLIRKVFLPLMIVFFIISFTAITISNLIPEASLSLNMKDSYQNMRKFIDKENILKNLKIGFYTKNDIIYAKDWEQSKYFIAEVVKGLNPVEIGNYDDFIKTTQKGNLLLIENNSVDNEFISSNKLTIVQTNMNWIIVK